MSRSCDWKALTTTWAAPWIQPQYRLANDTTSSYRRGDGHAMFIYSRSTRHCPQSRQRVLRKSTCVNGFPSWTPEWATIRGLPE